MKRLTTHFLIALVAFLIGVSAAYVRLRFPSQPIVLDKNQAKSVVVQQPTQVPYMERRAEPERHSLHTSRIIAMLNELAEHKGKSKTNTFDIAANEPESKEEFTRVYWKEDNSIIILESPYDPIISCMSGYMPGRGV